MFSLRWKNILFSTILLITPVYFWKKLYDTYLSLKKELDSEKLFYERHNTVVMYARDTIRGWPPNTIVISKKNLECVLDPYLYFINTAKHSLDIAVMVIAISQLIEAVCEAAKRGVQVRIIVNFQSVIAMNTKYNKLSKAGVKIAYYIPKSENFDNIMHFKYMVKDYNHAGGFVCMGSMNYTAISTILNNYEDVVFSSNKNIVEQFYTNFEQCYQRISLQNDESIFNRSILSDSGFL